MLLIHKYKTCNLISYSNIWYKKSIFFNNLNIEWVNYEKLNKDFRRLIGIKYIEKQKCCSCIIYKTIKIKIFM